MAFDSPDKYGKGLDWTGYTVHDAANILRRYFNQLPEPIIPLGFYERFRVPLRNHQEQAVHNLDSNAPESGGFDADMAIRAYQGLITELPPLNRQLLLYILDLLAVFASKSDLNKMNTSNLAAIFQPGILSHPQHDLAPQEYRLSQDVLIFLIENQDHFLIGMHGTAADEKTVQEVQSGYQRPEGSPTGAPSRSRTVIGRSSSNASGGSQGTRVFSGIRRNVSTSSRNSRQSSGQPGSPALGSPSLAGGVHRSNTVPSQRTATSPRFPVDKSSDPPTPTSKLPTPLESDVITEDAPQDVSEVPVHTAANVIPSAASAAPAGLEITSASSSEATTPLGGPAAASSEVLAPNEATGRTSPSPLLSAAPAKRDASNERSGSRTFLDRLRPPSGGEAAEKKEQRQTRKLQKKRVPSSNISSAHSSTNDLGQDSENQPEKPLTPQYRDTDPMDEARPESAAKQRIASDSLGPGSPNQSFQSRASITDVSDAEYLDEQAVNEKQEKKKRWRFSHSAKSRQVDGGQDSAKSTPSMPASSSVRNSPDVSRAGSGAQAFQASAPAHSSTMDSGSTEQSTLTSDSDEKKKGPIGWIRGKIHERKEKDAEKRAKSPTPQVERQRSVQTGPETQASPVQASQVPIAQAEQQTPSSQPNEAPAVPPAEASSGVSSAGTPTPTPSTANVPAEGSTQAAAVAVVPTEEKKEEAQTEAHHTAEVKE